MATDIIVFDDVHMSFGGQSVYDGISFQVKHGQCFCIIGQSGVGKSVALRLMVGMLRPTRGKCTFAGRDLSAMGELELDELRTYFAMLFQNGALFDSMTIGENIAFPARLRGIKDRAKLRQIVEEKLYQVGLGKARFPDMPEKMPSMVSGGQRKRIALARAIAEEPNVLLYDEPTTGLDPIMSDAVADLINQTRQALAHKRLTSVVVTHDMHVALKVADWLLMLHGGKVVGQGEPDYFRRIRDTADPAALADNEKMIRQFVRGEAAGLIQAVL